MLSLRVLNSYATGEYRHVGDHGQDRHVHSGGDDDVELAKPLEQLPGRVEGVVDDDIGCDLNGQTGDDVGGERESSIQYSGTP